MCTLNPCQASEEAFDFLHTSESTQEGAWIKGLSREIKCQMTWLYLNNQKKKKNTPQNKGGKLRLLHGSMLSTFSILKTGVNEQKCTEVDNTWSGCIKKGMKWKNK